MIDHAAQQARETLRRFGEDGWPERLRAILPYRMLAHRARTHMLDSVLGIRGNGTPIYLEVQSDMDDDGAVALLKLLNLATEPPYAVGVDWASGVPNLGLDWIHPAVFCFATSITPGVPEDPELLLMVNIKNRVMQAIGSWRDMQAAPVLAMIALVSELRLRTRVPLDVRPPGEEEST